MAKKKLNELPKDGFQLSYASQMLSSLKLPMETKWNIPEGWPADLWEEYCDRDYRGRLLLARVMLQHEEERAKKIEEEKHKEKLNS